MEDCQPRPRFSWRPFFTGMRVAAGLAAGVAAARAHDTLVFQPKPNVQLGGMFALAQAPAVLHGMANVRLEPEGMEVELTMADSPTYRLLEHDPFPAPSPAGTGLGQAGAVPERNAPQAPSPTPPAATAPVVATPAGELTAAPVVHDPHFEMDQPLLTALAPTLLKITDAGRELKPAAVAVTITPQLDIVFRLTYPRPSPGTMRVELNYASRIPAGQKELMTAYDETGHTLVTAMLDAATPALEVPVPVGVAKAAAEAPARAGAWVAGAVLVIVAGFLMSQLRRRAARG